MKKIFSSLLLLSFSLMSKSQQIVHSEIVGRPTNNSAMIQMMFTDSVDLRAEYGTSTGNYSNQTTWIPFADSVMAEVIINGLQANTKYFYRMNVRLHGATNYAVRPEFSFHTQRQANDSFVYVVQADPHMDASSDTALYRRCLQNQLNDHPDFMIDLGDFLMTDKLKNSSNVVPKDTIPYRCKLLRERYEIACHSMPLFNVLGNHEAECGWYNNNTVNNLAVWDAIERKKYFPMAYPDGFYTGDTSNTPFIGKRGSYYAFTWGSALFVVIDPYWFTSPKPDSLHGWYWSLGKQQYDWLKKTLETSNSKFKFVFSHQIVGGDREGRGGVEYADLYEWGGKNLDGTDGWPTNRVGWYKPIRLLLEENKVNIFFHGHDHFFGKQELNCMIYQETPQPSLPNFNYPNSAAPYGYLQGLILGNTGHLRVTVTPQRTKVEYVKAYLPSQENSTRHNGDVVATYFIGEVNCYDTLNANSPTIWNSEYAKEIVYPNPFSELTKIEFTVEKTNNISIHISDASGKIINTLIENGNLTSGKYQLVWDGKDESGNDMPNGNYYFTITGASLNTASGKIILIK
jgi:hypothetical protein